MLPLDQPLKRYLSSDNYHEAVGEAFTLLDILYTYFFRYPWLLEEIQGAMSSHGAAIDFIASNPIAGVGLTLLFGAAAAAMIIKQFCNQNKVAQEKAESYKSSSHSIQAQLSQFSEAHDDQILHEEVEEKEGVASLISQIQEKRIKELNQSLKILLEKDEELSKEYESIAIIDTHQVKLILKEPGFLTKVKNKVISVVSASWVTLGLCSFAYWILWIGVGVVTGHFAPFGIEGLGAAGFAIPLAVGGIYPLIKIRNWFRNHWGQKTEQKDTPKNAQLIPNEGDSQLNFDAMSKVSKLLRRAVFENESASLQAELKGSNNDELPESVFVTAANVYISGDEQILALGQNKWRKTLMTGLSKAISMYVSAQYASWIVTDILKAAGVALNMTGLAMGFGIFFMVGSGIYGIVKAVQTYRQVQEHKAKIAKQEIDLAVQEDALERSYAANLQKLHKLKGNIWCLTNGNSDELTWLKEQSKQINKIQALVPESTSKEEPSTLWAKVKNVGSRAFTFLAGGTTGVMIARIATISGTVTFLPFAAAALSNPVTIGILVACGLVYGCFKVYEYHEAQKETRAMALLEQREEKIESLRNQLTLANLQIKLLEAKEVELRQKQQIDGSVDELRQTNVLKKNLRHANAAIFFSPCHEAKKAVGSDDNRVAPLFSDNTPDDYLPHARTPLPVG